MIRASRWVFTGTGDSGKHESGHVKGVKSHYWMRCGSKVQILRQSSGFQLKGSAQRRTFVTLDCGLAALIKSGRGCVAAQPSAATRRHVKLILINDWR